MNLRPSNIEKGEGGGFSLFKLIGPIIMSLIVASQWHFLINKHAVLAGCSAFWTVNCIFCIKKCGHVAPLSGRPSVTDLYSVPLSGQDYHDFLTHISANCCTVNGKLSVWIFFSQIHKIEAILPWIYSHQAGDFYGFLARRHWHL
jgi:hypothetical protein